MTRISWTPDNCQILTEMYDAGKTDLQISEYFSAGTYAIGKQRSKLGLVPYKKAKGLHRCAKTIKEVINKPFYVVFYTKDSLNHFSMIESTSEEFVKTVAKKMIYTQGISEVTILQPTTKLVMQTVTEIKL